MKDIYQVHKVFQYYSSPYYYCQKYDNILDFDLVENGHETVNDIAVVIRMNDPEIPTIQLKIFDGSIERSSDNYFKYIKKAQNIISYLTIITNNRDTANSNRAINNPTSAIDEIRQYKQLLDEGIITQQEFDAKKIEIVEMKAELLTTTLQDVDMAVINGNYAIDAGLKVSEALAIEAAGGTATEYYQNVIAVKEGNENSEKIQALLKALKSDAVKEYIQKTYNGAVVPLF